MGNALAVVRDAAHACLTALGPEKKDSDPGDMAARKAARSSLEELHETAVRTLEAFKPEMAERFDVVWLEKPFVPEGRPKRPPALHVAPIGVSRTYIGWRYEVLLPHPGSAPRRPAPEDVDNTGAQWAAAVTPTCAGSGSICSTAGRGASRWRNETGCRRRRRWRTR